MGSKVPNLLIVDCRSPKEANGVDGITKDVSDIDFIVVISEVNLVGSNPKEWWINTGAIHHMCFDKMFSTFEPIETEENVSMGNSATSKF